MKPYMQVQGPRFKVQGNSKLQTPGPRLRAQRLGLETLCIFGPWNLGLGPSALC